VRIDSSATTVHLRAIATALFAPPFTAADSLNIAYFHGR
jgi:hypothetical protein